MGEITIVDSSSGCAVPDVNEAPCIPSANAQRIDGWTVCRMEKMVMPKGEITPYCGYIDENYFGLVYKLGPRNKA